MKTTLMITLFVLIGCSSNKVGQLNTEIDPKGFTRNGVIGLKDNEAIIQEKVKASDELEIQQWKNFALENELNHEHYMAMWCYNDLSDPRLGGNGELPNSPSVMNLKDSVKIKEELGLDGENLIIMRTSSFKEQLEVERKYFKSLTLMNQEVKKSRASCERKMTVARLKAGLPSKRYQGEITINKKGEVDSVIKEHEKNLDDAFRINNQETKTGRTPASFNEVIPSIGNPEMKQQVEDLLNPTQE